MSYVCSGKNDSSRKGEGLTVCTPFWVYFGSGAFSIWKENRHKNPGRLSLLYRQKCFNFLFVVLYRFFCLQVWEI